MDQGPAPDRLNFSIDLSVEEARRRAEVVAALGPDWDPVAALRDEEAATALLYSGLDPEQERLYAMLVAAGVLPGRGPGEAGPGTPGPGEAGYGDAASH
ncbi:hypothetical protein FE633_24280 [Streptomyces montanus]|uniref:Uncharacterized protein n=1 Tax=Streptomyces montanus TaxID=2580423 RepID=A0A5R9FM79_9ACTN|nr:DUF6400 family protein [Streptomyces montanus]TLS43699.1 hypothetical protein FE633_24280 [Streptomyces montanus]